VVSERHAVIENIGEILKIEKMNHRRLISTTSGTMLISNLPYDLNYNEWHDIINHIAKILGSPVYSSTQIIAVENTPHRDVEILFYNGDTLVAKQRIEIKKACPTPL